MTAVDVASGICYNESSISLVELDESPETVQECHSATGCRTGGGQKQKSMTRWDQNETNHSSGSLMSAMDQFVQRVEDMNENILVPCRLMDMMFDEAIGLSKESANAQLGTAATKRHKAEAVTAKRVLTKLQGVDLFQFYNVLNTVKKDLMWGTNSDCKGILTMSASSASITNGTGERKGHARRPSTVSTASTSSSAASDAAFLDVRTELSDSNEDSGVEAEEEYPQTVAETFNHHLDGLRQCLQDLTFAASYITNRYNNDLGTLIL